MHEDLRRAVEEQFPTTRSLLEDLVRIPSVSAPGFSATSVRHSAEAIAKILRGDGLQNVQLLEVPDAHPAVFGEIPGPEGSPTILLYAHHDVQPPGPDYQWTSAPFEPVERHGRLFARGSCDDKAGIALHIGAIRAHKGRLPLGIKIFIEGEEEIGSPHLDHFFGTHLNLLAADVIVIADSENWRVGTPALTTSLRGLVDCIVEVRTLEQGVHSGRFGGAVPDALSVLSRLLATLHDDNGAVAVGGLVHQETPPLDLEEDELRAQAGMLEGTHLIGTGTLTSRMWTKPAISVLAIDAPPVAEAINQLVPVARAKVSLRLAPGDNPDRAMATLTSHLQSNTPWGAQVNVTPGSAGHPIDLEIGGPANDAWSRAFQYSWKRAPVEIGIGGSIPFVSAFREIYPESEILLVGAADPTSRSHGPDESVDLNELRKAVLAEAIAIRLLAD